MKTRNIILAFTGILLLHPSKIYGQQWAAGIRAGVLKEKTASKYYGIPGSKQNTIMGQQLFLHKTQADNKRLYIELSVTHYQIKDDLSGIKKDSTGAYYKHYRINDHKFLHNIALYYSFIKSSQFELAGGLGAGLSTVIQSRAIEDSYQPANNKNNIDLSVADLHAMAGLNARYFLGKKWLLSYNASYLLSSGEITIIAFSIGAGFRF